MTPMHLKFTSNIIKTACNTILTVWLALSQLFLLVYIALSSTHRVTRAIFSLTSVL